MGSQKADYKNTTQPLHLVTAGLIDYIKGKQRRMNGQRLTLVTTGGWSPGSNWIRLNGNDPTGVSVRTQRVEQHLEFMIREARDQEFHAWLNLERGTFSRVASVAPTNISYQRPNWMVEYGGRKLFNLGLPEVWAYVASTVVNIVRSYDVVAFTSTIISTSTPWRSSASPTMPPTSSIMPTD